MQITLNHCIEQGPHPLPCQSVYRLHYIPSRCELFGEQPPCIHLPIYLIDNRWTLTDISPIVLSTARQDTANVGRINKGWSTHSWCRGTSRCTSLLIKILAIGDMQGPDQLISVGISWVEGRSWSVVAIGCYYTAVIMICLICNE